MSCLGVLFSLDAEEVETIKAFKSDEERLEYLQEEIEELYFEKYPERIGELDKSWDALHRSLTDGRLAYENGSYPLNHVIMGGEILYTKGDYIITLKTPGQVKKIASEIIRIDAGVLKAGYKKIIAKDYGSPLTEDDFEFTWSWFEDSKEFWQHAAEENRYVLFTADQ
jgi:hypothetical protein